MNDLNIWKAHILSLDLGGLSSERRVKIRCENNGVKFDYDIYNTLKEIHDFSRESSNFIWSKIKLAKEDKFTERDIDEILEYEVDSSYIINEKYNNDLLQIIYIYNFLNKLPIDKSTFESLGLNTNDFDKMISNKYFSETLSKCKNNFDRINLWFDKHPYYKFDTWFITDDKLTPKQKDDIAYQSYDDNIELLTLMNSKSVNIKIANAPIPSFDDEWIAYNNSDLKKLTEKAIQEYFYDFPINIESVQFLPNGGKGNTLGMCSWGGKKANFVLNQNMIKDSTICYIKLLPQLKGFDCKETLLHEMCHAVDTSLHGWKGSENDMETNGHGKGFMEIADVINHRADINIGQYSADFESDIFEIASDVYNYIKGKESYLSTFFHKPYFLSNDEDLRKIENMWMCNAYDCDESPNHVLYNLFYTYHFVNKNEYKYSDIETFLKENDLNEWTYK